MELVRWNTVITYLCKPVSQSCAVVKSEQFWWASGQSNLSDSMEDCSTGKSVVVWVRKANIGSFCYSQLFVHQVRLSSGPPEFLTFSYWAYLWNWLIYLTDGNNLLGITSSSSTFVPLLFMCASYFLLLADIRWVNLARSAFPLGFLKLCVFKCSLHLQWPVMRYQFQECLQKYMHTNYFAYSIKKMHQTHKLFYANWTSEDSVTLMKQQWMCCFLDVFFLPFLITSHFFVPLLLSKKCYYCVWTTV